MATNLFEVPDKYLDILTWNMIFFTHEKQFCVFFQILHKIYGFYDIYYNLLLGNVLPWLPTIQSHYKEKQVLESRSDGLSVDTKYLSWKIMTLFNKLLNVSVFFHVLP